MPWFVIISFGVHRSFLPQKRLFDPFYLLPFNTVALRLILFLSFFFAPSFLRG